MTPNAPQVLSLDELRARFISIADAVQLQHIVVVGKLIAEIDDSCRALASRVAELEEQRIKYGTICVVCGADKPCSLKDDLNSPCTFDPAPRALWDQCKQLKQQLADAQARVSAQRDLITAYTHSEAVDQITISDLVKQHAALREALTSIAHNTCCGPCREASLVARKALATGAQEG